MLEILFRGVGSMVSLYLQERDDALTQIFVFLNTRAVHLMQTVVELAPIAAFSRLEDKEMSAFLLPVSGRTDRQLLGAGTSAYLGLGEFNRYGCAIPFFDRGAYYPQLCIRKIRDLAHYPCGGA